MERKIGEIFEHDGEWYQCVKDDYPFNCHECCFFNGADRKCSKELTGYCCSEYRYDGEEIIFKKLEKVGEPYNKSGITVQKYKVSIPIEMPGEPYMYFRLIDNTVEIGIKQNQEDMEEKKLNLKEFDLENAKAGKPVCTRDGRKARIICFDAEGNKPLIILSKINGQEVILRYTEKGQSDNFHSPTPREDDLMMLPEKHEGWVNVVKCGSERNVGSLYSTKEDALKHVYTKDNDYVATVKIEWEE